MHRTTTTRSTSNQNSTKRFGHSVRFYRAYHVHEQATGYNISEQSINNFKKLFKTIKNPTCLPTQEREKYQSGFLLEEKKLITCWQEHIVPTFTAKHAAEGIITFTKLASNAKRQRQLGQEVNNSHTGLAYLQENNFFVMGPGETHLTPSFVSNNPSIITVIMQEAREDLQGLWISGHLQEYMNNNLPIYQFGTTTLEILFDYKNKKKTYIFRREDGTIIKHEISYYEELFAADKNIDTIFDALVLQFIHLLRCIGGTYQTEILANADNPEVIKQAFLNLFHSWVYPEVKLPSIVDLGNSYVKITPPKEDYSIKQRELFQAVMQNDLSKLESYKEQGLLNLFNKTKDNAAFHAIEHARTNVAIWLINNGIDLSWRNNFRQNLLELAVINKNKIVISHLLNMSLNFQSSDNIKIIFNLKTINHHGIPNILGLAFNTQDDEIIELILRKLDEQGMVYTNKMPIIACMYQAGCKNPRWLAYFANKGINIDCKLPNGMNAIQLACQAGDMAFLQNIKKFFKPNLKQTYQNPSNQIEANETNTLLHFAALSGDLITICWLLGEGADPNALNFRGFNLSTYVDYLIELTTNELNSSSEYIENPDDSVEAMFRVADNLRQQEAKHKLREHKEKLLTIKTYLERNLTTTTTTIKNIYSDTIYRSNNVVVLVHCRHKNRDYFLWVRKKNNNYKAYGFYLFPGGAIDWQDDSAITAALRELQEETGLSLTEDQCQQINQTSIYADQQLINTTFVAANLGELVRLPNVFGQSDCAEARWIALEEIEESTLGPLYKNIGMQLSNYLLIKKLFGEFILDESISNTLKLEQFDCQNLKELILTENYSALTELRKQGLDFAKTIALIIACTGKNERMVQWLLAHGCNINQVFKINGTMCTAFSFCLSLQQTKLAEFILRNTSFNINANFYDLNALILCCKARKIDLVNLLIAKKVDLSQGIGGAALLAAIYSCDAEIVTLLINLSCIELNQQYHFGNKLSKMPKYPLELAFNCLARPNFNETQLLALENIIQILINHGTRLDKVLSNNETILDAFDESLSLTKAFAPTEKGYYLDEKLAEVFGKFDQAYNNTERKACLLRIKEFIDNHLAANKSITTAMR